MTAALQASKHNKKMVFQCLVSLAVIYARWREFYIVEALFQKSLEIVSGNQALETLVLAYFASIQWAFGSTEKAFELACRINAKEKVLLDPSLLAVLDDIERDFHQQQRDLNKLLETIATFKTVAPGKREEALDLAFEQLYELKNYDGAKENFLDCATSAPSENEKVVALSGLASALWETGNYDQANEIAAAAVAVLAAVDDDEDVSQAANTLVSYYQLSNDPVSALKMYSSRTDWPTAISAIMSGFEELARQHEKKKNQIQLELSVGLSG